MSEPKNINRMDFELNGQQYVAELGKCKSPEIINAIDNAKNEIINALSTTAITLDSTLLLSELPGFFNLDGAYYYQVKARNVGEETEVVFCDRDGTEGMVLILPYNCAVLNFIVAVDNRSGVTPVSYGFNQDSQNKYNVVFNAASTSAPYGNATARAIVMTLEISKNEGSNGYTPLGEFYISNSNNASQSTSPIIMQGIVPITL